jgi:ATP-dependent Clp protease ATP-binding subunit ClpA
MGSIDGNQLSVLRAIAARGTTRAGDALEPPGLPPGWEAKTLRILSARGLIEGEGSAWQLTVAGRDTLVNLERLHAEAQRRTAGHDALGGVKRGYAAAQLREDQSAFDRFTAGANQVIVLARSEAKQLGDTQLDSEHLLLGLLRTDDGVVAEVLALGGVTIAAAQEATAGLVVTRANGHEMRFTPRARRTLERALSEALSADEEEIAPHHILLALLDQRDGLAAQIVQDLDLDVAVIDYAAREAIERPDAWPQIKERLEAHRLKRLDAFLLAAASRAQVFEAIAAAASDDDARNAVAAILDIDHATAAHIIRRPLHSFTPARIANAEHASQELRGRRDASERSDSA